MSDFIRPEIRRAVIRHREALWAAAGLLAAALLLWRGVARDSAVLVTLGACLGALTLFLWAAWRQRARFRRDTTEPGLVEITEAQISYFGPRGGGIVDRDALTRVQLVSARNRAPCWVLHHAEGSPVSVPLAAEGADRLVDVLIALPGAEINGALSRLNRQRNAIVEVWSRQRER